MDWSHLGLDARQKVEQSFSCVLCCGVFLTIKKSQNDVVAQWWTTVMTSPSLIHANPEENARLLQMR